MDIDIKNQHYVWRHYLKPWLIDGKIWCNRKNNIFCINIDKIAKENYFYRAERLNHNEELVIRSIIRMMDPSSHHLLNGIYSIYSDVSKGTEFEKNNLIENYHGFFEKNVIPILEYLYSDDLSFWDNESLKSSFCYYIGLQYTRTKKSRDGIINSLNLLKNHSGNPGNINPINIANILSLIIAEAIGNNLFSETHPFLIHNNTNIGFLTSDQPVYNLHSHVNSNLYNIRDFEIFYPISPNKALILYSDKKILDNNNIDYYNSFISNTAREYIFGNSKEDLLKYISNR